VCRSSTKQAALHWGPVGNRVDGRPVAWVWVPLIWVTLRPAAAYGRLVQLPLVETRRGALTGPLFLVFFFGCTVSLIASGRLTLRLVAGGAANASFVPLVEIAALAAVWGSRRQPAFSKAVSLFFLGHGPWLLWLLGFSALWSWMLPEQAFGDAVIRWAWYAAGLVLVWSAYIDFWFFRLVLDKSPLRAAWGVLLQRAISWTLGLLIFGGGSLGPEIARVLH
jgi:hypothetical protein